MPQPSGDGFSRQSVQEQDQKLHRVSELYHENSKLRHTDWQRVCHESQAPGPRPQSLKRHRTLQKYSQRIQYGSKQYQHVPRIPLSAAPLSLQRDLGETIRWRRSQRHYSGEAISLGQLASLLFFSYGVTRHEEPRTNAYPRRAVPSGGALYPLECYALVLSVTGLAPGIYHYEVYSHSLEQLALGKIDTALAHHLCHPELARGAAVMLVISGVLERMYYKYQERGYRFMLQESGHVGAHMCLVATALGLAHCPVGGFVDDGINDLLGLNGVDEAVLYLFTIGSPAPSPLSEEERS